MARLSCKNACKKCLCTAVRLSFFARCHPAGALKTGVLKRSGVVGQKGNKSRQATVSYSFFLKKTRFSAFDFLILGVFEAIYFYFRKNLRQNAIKPPKNLVSECSFKQVPTSFE